MQYKSWKKNLFTVICRNFFKFRVYAFWGTFLSLKFCWGNGQALLATLPGGVFACLCERCRSAGGVPPHARVTLLTCAPPYPVQEGQEANGEAREAAAVDGEAEDEALPVLALHPSISSDGQAWCSATALYSVTCLLSLMIKYTHLATVYCYSCWLFLYYAGHETNSY